MTTELNCHCLVIGLAVASGAAATANTGESAHAKAAPKLLRLGDDLLEAETS